MAYKFRLQKVLDVKIKQEDNKKNEVYILNMEIISMQEKLYNLEKEFSKKGIEREKACKEGAAIQDIVQLNKYISYLQSQINKNKEEIEKFKIQLEEKKQEYMNSRKERKSYENLKEKDHAKFIEKELKEEDKVTDQIVCFANRKI